MNSLTYLPSTLIEILFPKLKQSFLHGFLIVDFVFGIETLIGYSPPCKLLKKLLLVFVGMSMSKWCFVEHKGLKSLLPHVYLSSSFEDA